jgi:catechol 2,3-dioxygenase-like lactoylglutathione lyase family enzyme
LGFRRRTEIIIEMKVASYLTKTQMRCLIWLLVAYNLMATQSFGQATDSRPILVAIQVKDVAKSAEWYSEFLGFSPVTKREFPDHGLKITVVELNNFRLELVENPKVLSRTDALQKLSVEDVTGFSKVTFRVPDIRTLYDQLQKKRAHFQIALKESNINADELFFIVLDADGNWLQFVGAK